MKNQALKKLVYLYAYLFISINLELITSKNQRDIVVKGLETFAIMFKDALIDVMNDLHEEAHNER